MVKSRFGNYQQNKYANWLIGLLFLTGLTGLSMAITNPDHEAYEEYAIEKIVTYLKEDGCSQLGNQLGAFLKNQCHTLVDIAKPKIKQIVVEETQRQNFLFFSIYETNLSIGNGFPGYHVVIIGVFNNFIIYEAEEI